MRTRPLRTVLAVTLAIFGVLVTLLSAVRVWDSGDYLHYLITRGDTFGVWAVLQLLSFVLAIVGVASFWLLWRRARLGLAAGALLVPLIAPFVLEANRCDVIPFCEQTDWARLPQEVFKWEVRYRDVDPSTARNIASGALDDAKLPYHAWDPRRVGGEWRVETRTDDMDLGPYEVVVDAQTGKAEIVRP